MSEKARTFRRGLWNVLRCHMTNESLATIATATVTTAATASVAAAIATTVAAAFAATAAAAFSGHVGFATLFHDHGLAAELDAALIINEDDLDLHHIAKLHDIAWALHEAFGEF
jgi:hypothetical protein